MTGKSPLDHAKDLILIQDAWVRLGIEGCPPLPGKKARSPLRADHAASFSIIPPGRLFHDFAEDSTGDVVVFVSRRLGISKSDAAKTVISWAGTFRRDFVPPRIIHTVPPRSKVEEKALSPLSGADLRLWIDGSRRLQESEELQGRIDAWRGWPAGTARTLAEDGQLACTNLSGREGVAFSVHVPVIDELGFLTTDIVGFHHRHKPSAGRKASWQYVPNGTPALPFVYGCGFLPWARTIIVTEGQWDAITLCAAAGWLANDASWPEDIVVFATRGSGAWKTFLTYWQKHFPPAARFILFPDADESGAKWTAKGGFMDELRRMGYRGKVALPQLEGVKDLNELHKVCPLDRETIGGWIQ